MDPLFLKLRPRQVNKMLLNSLYFAYKYANVIFLADSIQSTLQNFVEKLGTIAATGDMSKVTELLKADESQLKVMKEKVTSKKGRELLIKFLDALGKLMVKVQIGVITLSDVQNFITVSKDIIAYARE